MRKATKLALLLIFLFGLCTGVIIAKAIYNTPDTAITPIYKYKFKALSLEGNVRMAAFIYSNDKYTVNDTVWVNKSNMVIDNINDTTMAYLIIPNKQ